MSLVYTLAIPLVASILPIVFPSKVRHLTFFQGLTLPQEILMFDVFSQKANILWFHTYSHVRLLDHRMFAYRSYKHFARLAVSSVWHSGLQDHFQDLL